MPPRPSGPEPTALVVVSADAVLAAGPATRQALAARAGVPWAALATIADRGDAVPIASSSTHREASVLCAALEREHRVTARVVEPGALTWLGGAITATVLGVVGLVVAVLLGIAFPSATLPWWLAILGSLALLVVGGWAAMRWIGDARDARGARDGLRELRALQARAPEAWASLSALRKTSLDPELPPTAQADLWTELDRLEARLLADPTEATALAELTSASRVLEGKTDASGALARALRASRAAEVEVSAPPRPPRGSESERS